MSERTLTSVAVFALALALLVNTVVDYTTKVEFRAYQKAVNERLAAHGEPPIVVETK